MSFETRRASLIPLIELINIYLGYDLSQNERRIVKPNIQEAKKNSQENLSSFLQDEGPPWKLWPKLEPTRRTTISKTLKAIKETDLLANTAPRSPGISYSTTKSHQEKQPFFSKSKFWGNAMVEHQDNERAELILQGVTQLKYDHIIIVGDFNLKQLGCDSNQVNGSQGSYLFNVCDAINDLILTESVQEPTRFWVFWTAFEIRLCSHWQCY